MFRHFLGEGFNVLLAKMYLYILYPSGTSFFDHPFDPVLSLELTLSTSFPSPKKDVTILL